MWATAVSGYVRSPKADKLLAGGHDVQKNALAERSVPDELHFPGRYDIQACGGFAREENRLPGMERDFTKEPADFGDVGRGKLAEKRVLGEHMDPPRKRAQARLGTLGRDGYAPPARHDRCCLEDTADAFRPILRIA